jgi:ArsR family transcriptional regulator, virulence genes transcriptional regulator
MSAPLQPGEGFGGTPEAAGRAVNLLKALSHEGRLQILCLLLDQEMSVGEIAAVLAMPQSSISQQLMRLRAEGIVKPMRSGKSVFYRLVSPQVRSVVSVLRENFCSDIPG